MTTPEPLTPVWNESLEGQLRYIQRVYPEAVAAAIERAARQGPDTSGLREALDVERLKRAMNNHEDAQPMAAASFHDCDFGCAAAIAAEYAALAATERPLDADA